VENGDRVLVDGVSMLESSGVVYAARIHVYSLYYLKAILSFLGIFVLAFFILREDLRGELVA